jgi:hypothetical protein
MATEYKAIFKSSEMHSSLKIRNVFKIRVLKEGFKNNAVGGGCVAGAAGGSAATTASGPSFPSSTTKNPSLGKFSQLPGTCIN